MNSLHSAAAQDVPHTGPPGSLLILPLELLVEILQWAGWRDVLNLRAVSYPHPMTFQFHPAERMCLVRYLPDMQVFIRRNKNTGSLGAPCQRIYLIQATAPSFGAAPQYVYF